MSFLKQQPAASAANPKSVGLLQRRCAASTDRGRQHKPPAGPRTETPFVTALPNRLRSGAEQLSGVDLSSVRVHFNSPEPEQYSALAFARGTEIHLGPGEEKHLPHEAWHVVQQHQGRVSSRLRVADANVNDESRLEHEADVMGTKALRAGSSSAGNGSVAASVTDRSPSAPVLQAASPHIVMQRVVVKDESKYRPLLRDISKQTVYRGSSSLTPQNALAGSINKTANNYYSILVHLINNGNQSKWVSTSTDREVAELYAGSGGWVYAFEGIPQQGLTANDAYAKHWNNKDEREDLKAVGKENDAKSSTYPFAWQKEVSVLGSVSGANIVRIGAYDGSSWRYYTRQQFEKRSGLPKFIEDRLGAG